MVPGDYWPLTNALPTSPQSALKLFWCAITFSSLTLIPFTVDEYTSVSNNSSKWPPATRRAFRRRSVASNGNHRLPVLWTIIWVEFIKHIRYCITWRVVLCEMDCFSYHEKSYKPNRNEGYQWTRVQMIFDVKTDLRWEARLVDGGHLLELLDTEVYSSTVKGISVKLLNVIARTDKGLRI